MRDAGDVLQRDAAGPLGHEFGVALRRRRIAQHHGPQPAEPDAQQMVGQQFGVDPGAGHAGIGQDRRGLADGSPPSDCPGCRVCSESSGSGGSG